MRKAGSEESIMKRTMNRGSSRAATRAAARPSRAAPSRAKPAPNPSPRPASKPAPTGNSRPTAGRATAPSKAKPVKPSRPPRAARSSTPPTKPAKAAKPKPPARATKAPKRTQRPRLKRYDEGGFVDEGGGGPSGSRWVYVGTDGAGNAVYQNRLTGATRTEAGHFNPAARLDTSQIEDARDRTPPSTAVATAHIPPGRRRDDALTDARDKLKRARRRWLP